MKGLLVRVGVDQAYGGWNAPVDAEGRFVYVPIPEAAGTCFHPGLERKYEEVLPALRRYGHDRDMADGLRFPPALHGRSMHLDPDFACLTYGDVGNRRGARLRDMTDGDLIAFYAGLRPVHPCEHRLVYALVGLYVVHEVVPVESLSPDRWHTNAHARKTVRGESDIVVRAKPAESGRFDRSVPIGEWRAGAYRVRRELLAAWGGLSVKDGYIQRSAVPPTFNHPDQFLAWLQRQGVRLAARNN
jgi:hypothetical protein